MQTLRVAQRCGALAYYYRLLNEHKCATKHDVELATIAATLFGFTGRNLMERICTHWLKRKDDGDGDVENCFKRDARGGHARDFILNEEDLLATFTEWLIDQSTKYLTVALATQYVNSGDFMGTQEMQPLLKKYEIKYPICASVVAG